MTYGTRLSNRGISDAPLQMVCTDTEEAFYLAEMLPQKQLQDPFMITTQMPQTKVRIATSRLM